MNREPDSLRHPVVVVVGDSFSGIRHYDLRRVADCAAFWDAVDPVATQDSQHPEFEASVLAVPRHGSTLQDLDRLVGGLLSEVTWPSRDFPADLHVEVPEVSQAAQAEPSLAEPPPTNRAQRRKNGKGRSPAQRRRWSRQNRSR